MGRHTQYIVSPSQEEKNKLHAIIFKMDWNMPFPTIIILLLCAHIK